MNLRHDGRRSRWWSASLAVALAVAGAAAQDPATDFRQNCANCHTIGGGSLTGPDLKGVTERRQRDWLARFIQNPKALIDGGDATAKQLLAESNGVVMPTVAGLTPERIGALIDLIAAESALPESQFIGLKITDKPFQPEDVTFGRRLFLGEQPLAKGGPACVGCHSVGQPGGLGGGRLGPDLTRVYERIQGRQALAAWLQAPPTATMKPLFANRPLETAEVLALLAWLEAEAVRGAGPAGPGRALFLILGLAGCAAVLLAFDAIWRGRFQGVRRQLVAEATGRAGSR